LRLGYWIAASAALVLLPSAGSAQALLGHAFAPDGDWDVSHYKTTRNCDLLRDFEASGHFAGQLEIMYEDSPKSKVSLFIATDAITKGDANAPVEIWFDSDAKGPAAFKGTAEADHDVDGAFLALDVDKSFLSRLAGARTMLVRIGQEPVDRYDVAPTRVAVQQMFDCHAGVPEEKWGERAKS